MALLHVLLRLRAEYGLFLAAVHVNHGIRGGEARRDEEFVGRICAERGIDLEIFFFDIKAFAKKEGVTEEEAGRMKRYEAFYKALNKYNANKIAVAHNLNDQAETVLMRLIRGTGTKGLAGIPAVSREIIRPLIERSREEIENFMKANEFEYKNDSSNSEEAYTRNKIRLNLIPYIKNELNPDIIKSLARISEISSDENEYIETMASEAYKKCVEKSKSGNISISELNKYSDVIKKRIVRIACMAAAKSLKDISYIHIMDILKLAEKTTGKRISLPYGLIVENSYRELIFSKEEGKIPGAFSYIVDIHSRKECEVTYIKEIDMYMTSSENEIKKLGNLNNIYTKRFDCDKIVGTLNLRSLKQGDKIYIKDVGSKKITRFLTDKKIPGRDRDKIPLLADGESILWIVGMRASGKHEADIDSIKTIAIQFWEENK